MNTTIIGFVALTVLLVSPVVSAQGRPELVDDLGYADSIVLNGKIVCDVENIAGANKAACGEGLHKSCRSGYKKS